MKPLFLALFLGIAVTFVRAQSPTPDPALCGPFPKLYKEIVWNWLEQNLVDAKSAKIEWGGDPKPTDTGTNGKHFYGWLVEFKINSRNQFGLYTGKQAHSVLLHDNQVVQATGF